MYFMSFDLKCWRLSFCRSDHLNPSHWVRHRFRRRTYTRDIDIIIYYNSSIVPIYFVFRPIEPSCTWLLAEGSTRDGALKTYGHQQSDVSALRKTIFNFRYHCDDTKFPLVYSYHTTASYPVHIRSTCAAFYVEKPHKASNFFCYDFFFSNFFNWANKTILEKF